jgi:hypothetical protein
MHRNLDAWKEFLIVGCLAVEIERQNTPHRFDQSAFERVHCLQDLIVETEALLVDIPEPERLASAVDAVKSAYAAVFSEISCPKLSNKLADAFRPHWNNSNFWTTVW